MPRPERPLDPESELAQFAAAGRKLPNLAVTVAYVRACGGDAATPASSYLPDR